MMILPYYAYGYGGGTYVKDQPVELNKGRTYTPQDAKAKKKRIASRRNKNKNRKTHRK